MKDDKTPPDPGTSTPDPDALEPGWEAHDTAEGAPIDVLQNAVTDASNRWLKERLGLAEDPEGNLHLPNFERFTDLGERADHFVRGFFRAFTTPTDGVTKPDAPQPTGQELAAKLIKKVNDTVNDAFQTYVKTQVPADSAPADVGATGDDAPKSVTIDGAFVLRHGPPIIGTVLRSLGAAFQDEARVAEELGAAAPDDRPLPVDAADQVELPDPEAIDATTDAAPEIKFDFNLRSMFDALFTTRVPGAKEPNDG